MNQNAPKVEVEAIPLELAPVLDNTRALVVTDKEKAQIIATLTNAKERLPALQKFAASVVIASQSDFEVVAAKRKEIKAIQKEVKGVLDEPCKKTDIIHRAWTSLKGLFIDSADEADSILERKQSAFIQEQKRIATELQAKLDREALEKERIEREKQNAAARKQREIEEAERKKAEEARRKQQEALEAARRAEAEAKRKQLEAEQKAREAEQEAIRQAAEAKNAKEREKIQREAAEKAKAALAEKERLEREEKARNEAAEKERQRLAKIAADADAKASAAAVKAEVREERAANVNIQSATVVANIPEVKGSSNRKQWLVKSVDTAKFIAAVANDPSLLGFIKIDEGALKRSKGANPYFAPAGVVFIEDIIVASRAK